MSSKKSEYRQEPRDLRPKIRAALKGEMTADELADALLDGGWNFTDPARRMGKSPEDVRDFLEGLRVQVCMWSTLTTGRQNLLQMICDAYCRWLDRVLERA